MYCKYAPVLCSCWVLKYCCICGTCYLIRLPNFSEGRFFWVVNALVGVFLMLFIPLTWFKKLWIIFNPPTEDDVDDCGFPRNRFLRFLYEASHRIMRSILSRTVIYLTIVATLCVTTLLHLVSGPLDAHSQDRKWMFFSR